MKVKVTEKKVSITEISEVYEGEFGINRCEFSLPKSFEGLAVTAIFNGIPVPLTDGKCIIPSLENGNCILGVYAYRQNGDETELMYSPKPTMFFVGKGSFGREIDEEIIPEVFSYETYCQMLQGYWRELFGENTLSQYKENATEHQFYSAKAVNEIHQGLQELSASKEYLTDQLAEFKERELDYTKIYAYDTEDLKNRTTHSTNEPIYEVNAYKNGEATYFEAIIKYRLQIAYKDENGNIEYYVDTPLNAFFDDSGKMRLENFDTAYDIGLMIDGKAFPLSGFTDTLVDETQTFYYGKVKMTYFYDGENLILEATVCVASEYEQAINQLLTEVQGLLSLCGDTFLIYFRNEPEAEIVQAQYTGGN